MSNNDHHHESPAPPAVAPAAPLQEHEHAIMRFEHESLSLQVQQLSNLLARRRRDLAQMRGEAATVALSLESAKQRLHNALRTESEIRQDAPSSPKMQALKSAAATTPPPTSISSNALSPLATSSSTTSPSATATNSTTTSINPNSSATDDPSSPDHGSSNTGNSNALARPEASVQDQGLVRALSAQLQVTNESVQQAKQTKQALLDEISELNQSVLHASTTAVPNRPSALQLPETNASPALDDIANRNDGDNNEEKASNDTTTLPAPSTVDKNIVQLLRDGASSQSSYRSEHARIWRDSTMPNVILTDNQTNENSLGIVSERIFEGVTCFTKTDEKQLHQQNQSSNPASSPSFTSSPKPNTDQMFNIQLKNNSADAGTNKFVNEQKNELDIMPISPEKDVNSSSNNNNSSNHEDGDGASEEDGNIESLKKNQTINDKNKEEIVRKFSILSSRSTHDGKNIQIMAPTLALEKVKKLALDSFKRVNLSFSSLGITNSNSSNKKDRSLNSKEESDSDKKSEKDKDIPIHVSSEKLIPSEGNSDIAHHPSSTSPPNSDMNQADGDKEQKEVQEAQIEKQENNGVNKIIPKRSNQSSILDDDDFSEIVFNGVPVRFHENTLKLLYSTENNGMSLRTLYNRTKNISPSIIAIRDTKQRVFGCYATQSWKSSSTRYYGTGECFVFGKPSQDDNKTMKVFKWSRNNSLFQFTSNSSLAIGGGATSHFALWIDEDLFMGTTSSCSTFDNPPLTQCSENDEENQAKIDQQKQSMDQANEFEILVLEVWGFTTGRV